jgi:2-polyprenyl-6-methoxyphenol hydroxylase-like FAD-dependent oxidoreductase
MSDPDGNARCEHMRNRRTAVIVGAGIAGLSAALRLRQTGWEPVVIERAPARRDGGFALVLHGIGYDTVQRRGLLPELEKRTFDPFELRYVGPDGRLRFSVPSSAMRAILGTRKLTLLRGDVEDVLYQRVKDTVDVRFGTTVRAIDQDTQGVRVALDRGTSLEADLLIGADGVHSSIRELAFGPEERFRVDLDRMVVAFMLDERPPGTAEGTTTTQAGVGRTVTVTCLGAGRTAAFFVYANGDPAAEVAKGPVRAVDDVFGELGWEVPQLRAQLRASASVYFDSVSQITLDRWTSGRVVLLGDAAWCVSLFAGYGASLAIGGADLLATKLQQDDDVTRALDAWETELRPTVRKRQLTGRRNTSAQAPPTRVHLAVRNLAMRLAARPLVQRILRRHLRLHT